MLGSIIELVGGLFLDATILLIGFCIVGSIVAALLAVSRGSATSRSEGQPVNYVGSRPDVFADAKLKALSAARALKLQPFPRK